MTIIPRKQLLEDQTAIRYKLLENGYKPLPAHEKMVTLRGWPKIDATEETIENWALSTAFCTTAIRIDDDLVAIDVDVNDEEIADKIEVAFLDAVPGLRDAALRFGKGSKFMFLVRCTDRPRILASHVWLRDGDQDDDHRVEIFGSGTTRYFTCFGPHTEGETTAEGVDVKIAYEWAEGPSPMTHRPEELVEVSMADLRTLVDIANEIMEAAGWERLQRSRSGELDLSPAFDLTDDMVFHCFDGETRRLDELADYAKRGQNARCTASWHEAGATNKSRCRIRLWHDGSPEVTDYAEFRAHLPENADRRTSVEKKADEAAGVAEKLGEALKLAGHASELAGVDLTSWMDEQVEMLLENWGYMVADGGSGYAVWLPDASRSKLSMPSFIEAHKSLSELSEPGPKGGRPKRYQATSLWSQSDRRVELAGYRYRPGVADRIIEEDGQLWVNNYAPPVEVDRAEHLDVWLRFMEHLTPEEMERDWLHNWLGWKVQNPHDRGAAVVFVSDGEQGTGRGTLFKILRQVFGPSNFAKVTYGKLVGTHGQSQFDEWRLDKVLVVCDEASSSEGQHHSAAKRKQYDALKEVIEPGAGEVTVNVKGEKTRTDVSYISLMIASNYPDALPIDTQDRRFAVLSTPTKLDEESKLFHDLFVTCHDGLNFKDTFIQAILDYYRAMTPVHLDFIKAPVTEAKIEMAELAEGVVERLVRERVELMGTPPVISSTALCTRVETALQQRNLSKMSGHVRSAVSMTLSAMGYGNKQRIRIGGTRHYLYIRKGKEAVDVHGLSEDQLQALVVA